MSTPAPLWPPGRLQRFFVNRLRLDEGEVRLDRRRIYVLPTRSGYIFCGVVVLIVLGATNYGASLGYFTAFLLTGIGLVSMLHSFRNMHGLLLRVGDAEPVFAGQRAHFPVRVHNPSTREHFMLQFRAGGSSGQLQHIEPDGWSNVEIPVRMDTRGRHRCPAIRVSTVFPLGLVRCWSWLKPTASCIVYPAVPAQSMPLPLRFADGAEGSSPSNDNEDFFGFREYRPGDPLRHIAWRTLARGQPLQTKEFAGDSGGDLWLNWDDVPAADVESRLRQLAGWVLEADARGLRYGLSLPMKRQLADAGAIHRHACLELLALF